MLASLLRDARRASCALLAVMLASSFVPRLAAAHDPRVSALARPGASLVRIAGGASPVYAVAPAPGAEAAPTAIYLHGIRGRPENGCPWFASEAFGWLVCPAATHAHGDGTFSWARSPANGLMADNAEALAAARGAHSGPSVLVGFSQGAHVAARLAAERPSRYRALVLIGASVPLDAAVLVRSGVGRVGLVAGDYDAASAPMRRAVGALGEAGVAVRFVSLGRVGHTYVPETPTHAAALTEVLAWAARPVGAPGS